MKEFINEFKKFFTISNLAVYATAVTGMLFVLTVIHTIFFPPMILRTVVLGVFFGVIALIVYSLRSKLDLSRLQIVSFWSETFALMVVLDIVHSFMGGKVALGVLNIIILGVFLLLTGLPQSPVKNFLNSNKKRH